MSRREQIIELLSLTAKPLDVKQIASALGIKPSEIKIIYEDLAHIARSLRGTSSILLMEPPSCLSCGYTFKDLNKPKRPSKCPKCKSERISNPRFIIRDKGSA
ncbi:MAG: hypothetical protein QW291_07295 [Thermofilaceae archaeon]